MMTPEIMSKLTDILTKGEEIGSHKVMPFLLEELQTTGSSTIIAALSFCTAWILEETNRQKALVGGQPMNIELAQTILSIFHNYVQQRNAEIDKEEADEAKRNGKVN
jgi:hypothetical protein